MGDPRNGGVISPWQHVVGLLHHWNTQFGTKRSLYLSPSQGRGHLIIIVTGNPQEGGFQKLQFRLWGQWGMFRSRAPRPVLQWVSGSKISGAEDTARSLSLKNARKSWIS